MRGIAGRGSRVYRRGAGGGSVGSEQRFRQTSVGGVKPAARCARLDRDDLAQALWWRRANMLERYVMTEELLAAGAPVGAHWIADRQSAPLLLRYGTEEQRLAFLPGITRGEIFFCIGMSEPDSGSDLASIRIRSSGRGRVRGHRRQGVDELCARVAFRDHPRAHLPGRERPPCRAQPADP